MVILIESPACTRRGAISVFLTEARFKALFGMAGSFGHGGTP